MTLSNEQQQALDKLIEFISSKESVICLSGAAGTGKTQTLKEFVQFLDSTDFPFTLCAPTHKAKLVLEELSGYEAMTLHRLLSLTPNIEIFNLDYSDLKFRSGGLTTIPTGGIVIVDEASMITDDLYKLLTEFSENLDSKILFVGDECQLKGVNNIGTSMAFACPNKISLTKIYRQSENNALMPILSKLRYKPIKNFNSIIASEGSLHCYKTPKEFMIVASNHFKKALSSQNVLFTKITAYTNARVKGLNNCMRRMLWNDELEYHKFEFLTGYENFEYNKHQFYNSLDYIITNTPIKSEKRIPHYMKLPGYELELYDSVYKRLLNVFILDRTINPDYIEGLSSVIENFRLDAIEAKNARNNRKASLLWKKYFEIMKSFATPKDMMFDNRVIKKKTFDYGYASSVHKLQGTSLNSVFVDMPNILQCKDIEELRQLQYVALSRTRTDAHILI